MKYMRLFRILMVAAGAMAAFATQEATAKSKQVPQIYVFGFSASFNDSTVYITDIQTVDSAWIDSKTKFLVNRDDYTYQMNSFFEEKGQKNRTSILFYDTKKKALQKKFEKIKKRYMGKDEYNVRYLPGEEFTFAAVAPDEEYTVEEPAPAKKEKAKKGKKMGDRPAPPQGGMPQGAPGGQRPPMM